MLERCMDRREGAVADLDSEEVAEGILAGVGDVQETVERDVSLWYF